MYKVAHINYIINSLQALSPIKGANTQLFQYSFFLLYFIDSENINATIIYHRIYDISVNLQY